MIEIILADRSFVRNPGVPHPLHPLEGCFQKVQGLTSVTIHYRLMNSVQ